MSASLWGRPVHATKQPDPEAALKADWEPAPEHAEWVGLPDAAAYSTPEPLLDGLPVFDAGGLVLLTAASKSRKSWLLQELAVGMASGVGWQGHPCTRPRRVMLVDLEIRAPFLSRRLQSVAAAMSAPPDELTANLRVLPWRGFDSAHKFGVRLWKKMTERIEAFAPELIILDPSYILLEGDENDHHAVRGMLSLLRRWCDNLGACVVTAHHHSKGPAQDRAAQDRASGSGVWARYPDAMLHVGPVHATHRARDSYLEDCSVVETTLRDHRPPAPWVTKWSGGRNVPVPPEAWEHESLHSAADLLHPAKGPKKPKSAPLSVEGVEEPKVEPKRPRGRPPKVEAMKPRGEEEEWHVEVQPAGGEVLLFPLDPPPLLTRPAPKKRRTYRIP